MNCAKLRATASPSREYGYQYRRDSPAVPSGRTTPYRRTLGKTAGVLRRSCNGLNAVLDSCSNRFPTCSRILALTCLALLSSVTIGQTPSPPEGVTAQVANGRYLKAQISVPTGVRPFDTNIPVCWTAPGFDPEKQIIVDAIRATWERYSFARFYGFQLCPTTGTQQFVRAYINMGTDQGGGGSAAMGAGSLRPPHWDPENRSLHIALPQSGSVGRIQYLGVHEFGHILGFMHEQDRGDNTDPAHGTCNPTGFFSASYSTWYDPDSIMHYCNPGNNSNGQISIGDRIGAGLLYPPYPQVQNSRFQEAQPDQGFGIGGPTLPGWSHHPANFGMWYHFGHSDGFGLLQLYGDGATYQDVRNLIPGQAYIVNAWAYASDSATAAQIWLHDTEGRNVTATPLIYPGTAWRIISLLYHADSTGAVRIHLQRKPGGVVFWDDVSVETAPPNKNFEQSTNGWNVWPDGFQSNASSIRHSGRLGLSQPASGGFTWRDVGGLTPGALYSVSVWMSSDPGGTTARGYLALNDSQNPNSYFSGRYNPGQNWTKISGVFKATDSRTIRIHLCRDDGTGSLYWDDVELDTVPANPSFENSFWKWQVGSPTLVLRTRGPARSGELAARLISGYGHIYQDVDGLTPSALYEVSAWTMSTGGSASAFLAVENGQSGNMQQTPAVIPGTVWFRQTLTYRVDATGRMRIRLHRNNGSGEIWWDDVAVVPM